MNFYSRESNCSPALRSGTGRSFFLNANYTNLHIYIICVMCVIELKLFSAPIRLQRSFTTKNEDQKSCVSFSGHSIFVSKNRENPDSNSRPVC